jgi:molybdopterin-guanine dinucleotide biosynthesis protein A
MDHSKILGTVLAGGKSVRLGMDKSQVKLADKLLIDYILSEIIEEFKEILIVANKSIDFQKSNKISVIEDFKKDLGPLGGVFTAMKWIKDNNKDYQWVSTFPTDSPFFKNKILKDFFNEIHPGESKLFFIKSNNTRHNIFGLWSLELMNKLEEDLNKGERKVEVWANSVGVKVINMDFEKDDPFFNINTKEDLEKAKVKIGND